MTRKLFWQLSAIAAATGLLCVAQAQSSDTALDTAAQPAAVEATEIIEPAVTAVPATEPAAGPGAEPAASAPAEPVAETVMAPKQSGQSVIIRAPAGAQQVAVPEPAATPVPAPILREQVVAEAVYANEHGLIPRGELSALHEDKSMAWVEQGMQAQQMAQLATRQQQVAMR